MSKLKELMRVFQKQDIRIEDGLTKSEIKELERIYHISFPKDWVDFYSQILPIGIGFYNWRDKSIGNIQFIEEAFLKPYNDILACYEEIEWNDIWGVEPRNLQHKLVKIRSLLEEAPRLIPIYGHRYLPIMKNSAPVLSIHDIDIICYGENLFDYFYIEFSLKKQKDICFDQVTYVPFWMDELY
ncbi:hypothetical protein IR123_10590 [Streptococcus sp. 19428wC2_LYSM12]|uniref:hypothetical protein n=1 Tax=unclassified Streptococcus TaxID=2608887 RepID=UPI00107186A0|nr:MULTISPECIES: hypothetical protein [unclassified Streptococcus]MBF0788317.1 hypothetical protein [Streptococcus sp. 19428wC2_LYSM12]TFV04578.1 hypothetical protein E4T79_10540 [Streptococcus sp. LYSM12]